MRFLSSSGAVRLKEHNIVNEFHQYEEHTLKLKISHHVKGNLNPDKVNKNNTIMF